MPRVPLLRVLVPFAAGIALADFARVPPALVAGLVAAALLGVAFARTRRGAEPVLVLALGMLALSLRLHAAAPGLEGSAVPVTLLDAPQRTGTTCRALGWVHGQPAGRALLRLTGDACAFPPGQRFVARLDGVPLPGQRNPGGRSAQREWARRGVQLRAAVRSPVVPIRTQRTSRARLEGLRRRLGDAVDGGSARSGTVLRALVIGDRSGVSPETRRLFEASGTAHLLAISGLHVGWVFGLLRLVARFTLGRVPAVRVVRAAPTVATWIGVAGAGAYAALAGLGTPSLRAAAMAAAASVALLSGRPGASVNALAAAALLVLIVQPAALYDGGFALSFTAVAGILVWRPPPGPRALLHVTLAAGAATAPWLAGLGLPLPSTAVVANAFAVPVFGAVVVPLGLLTAVTAQGVPALGAFIGVGASAVTEASLRALELLAGTDMLGLARVPGAVGLAFGTGVFAARQAVLGRSRAAAALASVALAALGVELAARPGDVPGVEVVFLDVGHGDAVLIRSEREAWLIDAGPRLGSFDSGRHVVAPALRALGVQRLDVLVVTHADLDHSGGAPAIVERFPIGEIWLTARAAESPALRSLRAAAARRQVPVRRVGRGRMARLGSARVDVLWPPSRAAPGGRRLSGSNDASIVLRLEAGKRCVVLPADVPAPVERELVRALGPCDVLKLAHHGSGSSTHPAWLERIAPDIAVVSAGRRPHAPLPHPRVRRALERAKVSVYETARHGAVRVSFSAAGLVVAPYLVP